MTLTSKGCNVFDNSLQLADKLQEALDVYVTAIGPRAALTLLQTCALAQHVLKENSFFLPEIGSLSIRMKSCIGSSGSERCLERGGGLLQ